MLSNVYNVSDETNYLVGDIKVPFLFCVKSPANHSNANKLLYLRQQKVKTVI